MPSNSMRDLTSDPLTLASKLANDHVADAVEVLNGSDPGFPADVLAQMPIGSAAEKRDELASLHVTVRPWDSSLSFSVADCVRIVRVKDHARCGRQGTAPGQAGWFRPRPPTVRFASIAGTKLRCREPPLGANCCLPHRSKNNPSSITSSARGGSSLTRRHFDPLTCSEST
jgi:hypothetical protein